MSSKKTLSGYFVLFIAIVCLAVVKDVRASVINTLVISEVFYDAPGADNELEWVELEFHVERMHELKWIGLELNF